MNVDEVRKQIMGSVDQVLLAHRGVDGQMRTAAQSVDASVKDLQKTKDDLEATLRATQNTQNQIDITVKSATGNIEKIVGDVKIKVNNQFEKL